MIIWLISDNFKCHFSLLAMKMSQAGKNTPIRRTAVRETGVTRDHGGEIEGAREALKHHIAIVLWWSLNWSPIMPRSASLSDSSGKFCQCHMLALRAFRRLQKLSGDVSWRCVVFGASDSFCDAVMCFILWSVPFVIKWVEIYFKFLK